MFFKFFSAGARADLVSSASGFAPPHLVADKNHLDLLQLIFRDQDAVDVNIKAAEFQKSFTPLHVAAEKGSLDCVNFLLEFEEVDVDAKDLKGDITPLHLAIKNKHKVRFIIHESNQSLMKKCKCTKRYFFLFGGGIDSHSSNHPIMNSIMRMIFCFRKLLSN